jgi:hypothetical protein
MTEWISVEDRLPEKNQRVLAWYDGYDEHTEARWHREGIEFAVFWYLGAPHSTDGWADEMMRIAREHIGATHLEITHWMSLPEPPK